MPAGVKVQDITVGAGVRAERGVVVTFHDRGFLHRGEQFRSSYDESQPLRIRLGRREVIAGLERGMLGMRGGRPPAPRHQFTLGAWGCGRAGAYSA